MKKILFLFLADAADGNGNAPQTAAQINTPQTGQVNLPPPNAPAPPPSAQIVKTGTKTEDVIKLEDELASVRQQQADTILEKKQREERINVLEDELFQLKKITGARPPKKEDDRTDMQKFMAGEL